MILISCVPFKVVPLLLLNVTLLTTSYAPGPGTILVYSLHLDAFPNDMEGDVFILELKVIYVTLYLPTLGTSLSNLTKLDVFFYFENENAVDMLL